MLKIKLLIIYLLLVISQAVAQVTSPNATYNNVDITTVNVDNLSDAQIKNYWDRAQAQGYSLDQFVALARSRGMQETQVMKLKQRIMQLSTSSDIKNKLKENTKTGRRRLKVMIFLVIPAKKIKILSLLNRKRILYLE